jgi:hypothetical protein
MEQFVVCDTLNKLEDAVRQYASAFDAALLSSADTTHVVRMATAIENMVGTVKSLAAARAAEVGAWQASGARSAAAELAKVTGSTVSGAKEVLETARRLASLPVVAAAARRGELSGAQAAAIASAAEANPGRRGPPGGAGGAGVAGRAAGRVRPGQG